VRWETAHGRVLPAGSTGALAGADAAIGASGSA
jgi:hypothetical protein